MDNVELKNELSFVLSKLKAAQRSCVKNKFWMEENLGDIIWNLESELDDLKNLIEQENKA